MTKYIGLSGDPAIHEMSGEGGIGEMLTQDPETAGVFWTDFVAADMRALWDALISRALMSQSSRSDQWKNWEASLDALVASARLDLEKTSLLHPEDLQQWIGELMDRVEPVDPMRLYPEAASLFTSLLSMFVEVADSLHGYVSVATECIADALKALRSDEYAAVVGSYRHREDVLAREEKTSSAQTELPLTQEKRGLWIASLESMRTILDRLNRAEVLPGYLRSVRDVFAAAVDDREGRLLHRLSLADLTALSRDLGELLSLVHRYELALPSLKTGRPPRAESWGSLLRALDQKGIPELSGYPAEMSASRRRIKRKPIPEINADPKPVEPYRALHMTASPLMQGAGYLYQPYFR